ncbi:DUF7594 domain-containing protein, partial [Herbiconiux sp. P16]|uniref:CBM96 family carbohydrate-binding protein n=1 Tax=Herbiconiux wuyangfengii TaxID=3342794 RepID=UPI0035B9F09D
MANAQRFSAIASATSSDAVSGDLAGRVLRLADAALSEPPVTSPGNVNGRQLQVSREILERTYNLAMAWRLTSQTGYLDRMWQDIQAASEFASWNPDHFLDTAEMTHAFAIAYDWAYAYWSPAQRTIMRDAIITKGLTPALAVYNADPNGNGPYKYLGNWSVTPNNVNIVVNSAMILGALAVAGDSSSPTVSTILSDATDSLRIGLAEYSSDGGFVEGPTYWLYATRYVVSAILALRSSTGSDYGLATEGGLSQTSAFMLGLTGPSGRVYEFADSAWGGDPNAVFAGLGAIYSQVALKARAAQAPSSFQATLQLLWRDSSVGSGTPASAPLDDDFNAGVTVSRSSLKDANGTFVAFRSASNPRGYHQQVDGGDFGIQALGEEWTASLPYDEATYDLQNPDVNATRWSYYRMGAAGHNTLLANPLSAAQPELNATSIVSRGATQDSAFTVSDLTAMYSATLMQWQRGVKLFDSRGQVLVQDELRTSSDVEMMWSMHTKADIQVASDGRSAVLFQNGERLLARIVSTGTATFSVEAAQRLPTSPPLADAPNNDVKKLAVLFHVDGDETFAVQFTPIQRGTDVSDAPAAASLTALGTWQSPTSSPSRLDSLSVGGSAVQYFDPATPSYTVLVNPGAPLPVVSGQRQGATVDVQQATSDTRTARVTVSERGKAVSVYVVNFPVRSLSITSVTGAGNFSGSPYTIVDGRLDSYISMESGSSVTVKLTNAASLASLRLNLISKTAGSLGIKVETSADAVSWSQRFDGSVAGTGRIQSVPLLLSPGSSAQYIRVSTSGSLRLLEFEPYTTDARSEFPPSNSDRLLSATLVNAPTALNIYDQGTIGATFAWQGATKPVTTRWVSSDSGVISIDSQGRYTAVAGGKAQLGLLAWTADGVTVTASVTVTVTDSTRVRLYAVEDSYVQSTAMDTNFGSSSGLLSKPTYGGSPDRLAYLKFDLSSLAGRSVTSATLSVSGQITDGPLDVARADVHGVTGDWSESSVTYRNKPTMAATVASFLVDRTLKVASADLTAHVQGLVQSGTGAMSLGVTQDNVTTNAVIVLLPSRESSRKPYIDITIAPTAAPQPRPVALLGSVALAGAAPSLEIGATSSLSAVVKDSLGGSFTRASVTFASQNAAVADVTSAGVVTAKAVGTAPVTITATADGVTVTASVTVTVTDSTVVRLYAVEDSYVQSTAMDTNFGSSSGLLSKPTYGGSPDRLAYLKFDLSSLAGRSVTSATLSVSGQITDGPLDVARADVHGVTGDWSESSVTYRNKPTMAATVASFLVDRTLKVASADLTAHVQGLVQSGTGAMSLGVTQDNVTTNAVIVLLPSRESSRKPYIDI